MSYRMIVQCSDRKSHIMAEPEYSIQKMGVKRVLLSFVGWSQCLARQSIVTDSIEMLCAERGCDSGLVHGSDME
jgi:hypothetical protein